MKTINEQFSKHEFAKLEQAKGNKSWREWMLDSAEEQTE